MGKRKGTSAAKKRDKREQRQKVPPSINFPAVCYATCIHVTYTTRLVKAECKAECAVFAVCSQDIRAGHVEVNLKKEYCNSEMVCDSCQNKQKNRAFCYFCSAVQRLPQCAECGRTKCMVADCTVPHAGKSATGNPPCRSNTLPIAHTLTNLGSSLRAMLAYLPVNAV